MSISSRQLKVFEATTRLGKLTLAAQEQSLSQSAASQSLKELESLLGYPLFIRVGRELTLTDDGEQVLPHIRQMLTLLENIENRTSSDAPSGPLRIAASVTIASYLLPSITAQLMEQYPQINPDIQIFNTTEVIERLEKHQAHIGLIEGPSSPTTLKIQPWKEDILVLFCRADHPLARKGSISLEDIATQRWVLREQGSGTRAVFDLAIQKVGVHIRSSFSLNRQEAIKQSVKAGLGIGCLSSLSITEEVARGEFVILNSPLDLKRRFSLVTTHSNGDNPAIHAFLSLL